MTLAGELLSYPQARLNDPVCAEKVACREQGHELGNEKSAPSHPMINPCIAVLQLLRPDVRHNVFGQSIEGICEVFPVHSRSPALICREIDKSAPQLEGEARGIVASPQKYGVPFWNRSSARPQGENDQAHHDNPSNQIDCVHGGAT